MYLKNGYICMFIKKLKPVYSELPMSEDESIDDENEEQDENDDEENEQERILSIEGKIT